MHIILGLLGTIVTILVLLNRLRENGIDIGWLNPFTWHRRKTYRKEHDLTPAFKLDSPMEVAALYVVSIAKIDGDISKEQKAKILYLFENEFHLSTQDARDLLKSSVYLLSHTNEVFDKPEKVMERCFDNISSEQMKSICYLIDEVANVEESRSLEQQKLISKIKKSCLKPKSSDW